MCKAMMGQRNEIEAMIKADLERCVRNIEKNGCSDEPIVKVDLETLFIANRDYFENQGFFFEPEIKVENNRVRYYASLKLGGESKALAIECWKKIRDAKAHFARNQRKEIFTLLREAQGSVISVDMSSLLFENKLYFEEVGFYFEPESCIIKDGKSMYLARMKKRR